MGDTYGFKPSLNMPSGKIEAIGDISQNDRDDKSQLSQQIDRSPFASPQKYRNSLVDAIAERIDKRDTSMYMNRGVEFKKMMAAHKAADTIEFDTKVVIKEEPRVNSEETFDVKSDESTSKVDKTTNAKAAENSATQNQDSPN